MSPVDLTEMHRITLSSSRAALDSAFAIHLSALAAPCFLLSRRSVIVPPRSPVLSLLLLSCQFVLVQSC
jgi:hypothetical protein